MILFVVGLVIVCLLAVLGMALIYGGQYLHKEKFFKTGLREGLHNTSISDYPEHKKGKKLLIYGQICILIDVIILLVYFYFF